MAECIVLLIALIVQAVAIWQKNKLGINVINADGAIRMYVVWLIVQGVSLGIATQYWLIKLVNWIIGG